LKPKKLAMIFLKINGAAESKPPSVPLASAGIHLSAFKACTLQRHVSSRTKALSSDHRLLWPGFVSVPLAALSGRRFRAL